LPPSDVPDQVNAIKAATKKLAGTDKPEAEELMDAIKAKFKVMIVCETTRRNGSDVYTKPMCNSLRDNFTPVLPSFVFGLCSIADHIAGTARPSRL